MLTTDGRFAWMVLIFGYVICIVLAAFAFMILRMIWKGQEPGGIDLTALVSETNGDASMSRFQLLIFTFVIAFSLFLLVERTGTFPVVSDGILTLLGISASTYAVGKGISYSRDEGVLSSDDMADKRDSDLQMAKEAKGAAVAGAVQTQAVAGAPRAQAQAAADVAVANAVQTQAVADAPGR